MELPAVRTTDRNWGPILTTWRVRTLLLFNNLLLYLHKQVKGGNATETQRAMYGLVAIGGGDIPNPTQRLCGVHLGGNRFCTGPTWGEGNLIQQQTGSALP